MESTNKQRMCVNVSLQVIQFLSAAVEDFSKVSLMKWQQLCKKRCSIKKPWCSADMSIQFKTWSFVPKLTLIIKKSKKNSVKLGLLGNTEIGAVQPLLAKKWITMSSWEALLMKVCLNLLAQTTLSTAWDSLENGKMQVTNQHSDHSCFKNRHSFCLNNL